MRAGSIQRVVMVFPGALGDLLLALPAFRALRERHTGAHRTLVVSNALRPLAALTSVADTIENLDAAETVRLFADGDPPRWLCDAPALHCWMGVDDPAFRTRLDAWSACASFHRVERGPGSRHAAAAYARAAGMRATRSTLAAMGRLDVPCSARAGTIVDGVRRPVLAVHRGAGALAKRWDAEGFAAVARWWQARGGAVLDVVGPADTDMPPLPDATRIADWPLPELAALLAQIDAYVGNDSGVSHLAGAVGARGVVLFTATAPRRWRPPSRRLRVVSGTVHVGRVLRALERATLLDKEGP
ncbi:MAG TPA: glycosyltransferase family 9 protein [Candidatus Binatia bacterium]|nr:glycosyltransferase family 9 protein [Candidatus Binatia bacterium]